MQGPTPSLGAWACSLGVWLQSPPQSPSGVGAVEVSSRESPFPRHLGSGFPKWEALTTHKLGDGICMGSWGLGPGGLGEGERETGMGTWGRKRGAEGKSREIEAHSKSQRCGGEEGEWEEPRSSRENQIMRGGRVENDKSADFCLIFPH